MKFVRPLEIPFNFDDELIDKIYEYDNTGELYHCIYFPPFWEDYVSAKYYYFHNPNEEKNTSTFKYDMNNNRNMTREEYCSHIDRINKFFPQKGMLLLQQNSQLINEELLKDFYINRLKITKFCVGSVEQAKILKDINPDFEIIGSITMKAEPEDFEREDYKKYFDAFVLWFPYNRDIEKVKKLPKHFKYILLVNCDCSIFCQGRHHWLAKSQEDDRSVICPRKLDPSLSMNKTNIRVNPRDLCLWKDYIAYFKLQGREYRTVHLFSDIVNYSKDRSDEYNRLPQRIKDEAIKLYSKADEKFLNQKWQLINELTAKQIEARKKMKREIEFRKEHNIPNDFEQ